MVEDSKPYSPLRETSSPSFVILFNLEHIKMENPNTSPPEHTSKENFATITLTPSSGTVAVVDQGHESGGKSLSFILAFASLMATNFISIMDTVIVATALPAIARDLNARSNEAYWAGSGFLFAQAVSQPLYGTLSGVFGRKACLLFAMAIFTVASVFCATAQSMSWLIAARVVSQEPLTLTFALHPA